MSGLEDIAPETEEELEQRKQELIEDAKDSYEGEKAKQNEALAEIKKGEDLEQYTNVTLGELELEVKCWLPGDTTGTVQRAVQLAESEDMAKIQESMETMLVALDEMTTNDLYDRGFWESYYNEWGPTALIPAVMTILGPALDEMEGMKEREVDAQKADAANGFRTDSDGQVVRSRGRDDEPNSK